MNFELIIEWTARIVEIIGIAVIALGTVITLIIFLNAARNNVLRAYKNLRHNLGKVILLGLEILVAADIIATVVTNPTINQVLALGLIVLIRTFLSFSIQTELEGKLPWHRGRSDD